MVSVPYGGLPQKVKRFVKRKWQNRVWIVLILVRYLPTPESKSTGSLSFWVFTANQYPTDKLLYDVAVAQYPNKNITSVQRLLKIMWPF